MQFSRKQFLLASLAATSGTALAACGGGLVASSAASDGTTRKITDHGGLEVTLPAKVERVVIDRVPLESTYIAYFNGSIPFLAGMSRDRVDALRGTIAAEIAPDILELDTYDDGELDSETLTTLSVDAVLYDASDTEHARIFASAGVPAVGFTTDGDPTATYADWMHLLEDVFNEQSKMTDKINFGSGYVTDAQDRAATVTKARKLSALVLMGVDGDRLTVAAGTRGWFADSWATRLNYDDAAAGTEVGAGTSTEGGTLQVSLDQVLEWDPAAILVTGEATSGLTAADVLSGTVGGVDFTRLTAYKNKAVYSTGLGMWNWFTPNPDIPLATYWVGSSLYSKKFTGIDLKSLTKDYYKKMYDFDLSDEQVRRIIDPDA